MHSPCAWCRDRDDAVKAAGHVDAQYGKMAEDAGIRQSKSNAVVKRLEGDVAKLMNQIATMEHANRSVLYDANAKVSSLHKLHLRMNTGSEPKWSACLKCFGCQFEPKCRDKHGNCCYIKSSRCLLDHVSTANPAGTCSCIIV